MAPEGAGEMRGVLEAQSLRHFLDHHATAQEFLRVPRSQILQPDFGTDTKNFDKEALQLAGCDLQISGQFQDAVVRLPRGSFPILDPNQAASHLAKHWA